jgi:hypothetical protein
MLKLIYHEDGFWLEHLTTPLERWLNTRLMVAVRSAHSITLEPSTASFILPDTVPHWDELDRLSRQESPCALLVEPCDEGYVEVCLNGIWVGENPEAEAGVFVARLSDRTEFLVYKLWQTAESLAQVSGDFLD